MIDGRRRDWLLKLALVLVAATLLVVARNAYVRQATYPIPAIEVGAPPSGYQEVYWRLDSGVEVHGWHGGQVDASRPLVIFFHGNGENLETLKWSGIFQRFAELDVYGVVVEYPGYGKSGGSPTEAGLIAGGIAALDWVVERWPERPKIVAGWSLGAAVATQVAAARTEVPAGLVVMSAWSRLFDLATDYFPAFLVRLMLRERYDSITAAAAVRCPSLVIHGARDRIIQVLHGERLAEALGPEARWIVIEGVGHNDLLAVGRVWREFDTFLGSVR